MNAVELPMISTTASGETGISKPKAEANLQDLIPIAMVIVGGCETCAEKMVRRALEAGSSWQDIDKTLRIIAGMRRLECFANAVGPEIVARMEKPLETAQRTLQQAMIGAGK